MYYSPLFLTENPKNGLIKIHEGTLLDYCFVIDRKMNRKHKDRFHYPAVFKWTVIIYRRT